MNLLDRLLVAQIDTSFVEEHDRTYNTPFDEGYWFPEQASEFAGNVDFLFMAISWISFVFFAIIIAVMLYFIVKYRRRPGVDPEPSSSHNTNLEIFWSVVPSIILVWIFYVGASGYFDMRVATDDAEEIYVTARQFNWMFRYPNGDTSSELHLVQGQPAKLIMQSEDVLHSMFVSEFRQKMDIVPGRYTYAFIKPTKQGKFRLACAEYCGDEHSRMRTLCEVHASAEERRQNTEWIRADYTPQDNGKRLFNMNCSGCHGIAGEAKTGPALNLIWGIQETMANGDSRLVDEDYIKESLEFPSKEIVKGYDSPSKMNSFAGKFKPEELQDIIAYIKYVNDPVKYNVEKTVGELEAGNAAGDSTGADGDSKNSDAEGEAAPVENTTTEDTNSDDDTTDN